MLTYLNNYLSFSTNGRPCGCWLAQWSIQGDLTEILLCFEYFEVTKKKLFDELTSYPEQLPNHPARFFLMM
jgi:hypothetical protein